MLFRVTGLLGINLESRLQNHVGFRARSRFSPQSQRFAVQLVLSSGLGSVSATAGDGLALRFPARVERSLTASEVLAFAWS